AGASGPGSFYPTKWVVFDPDVQAKSDQNIVVSGFSKRQIDHDYAIYSPSHSCPMKTRGKKFHTQIMPLTLNQVIIFGNSEAKLEESVESGRLVLGLRTCGRPEEGPITVKIPLDDENATSFRLARNYVNKILHNCIIGSRNVDPHMRFWIIKTWSNTRL
ncbi:hypothetical protein PFISCL1PPCAC_20367, partial [Pristionchus fissidentatus]